MNDQLTKKAQEVYDAITRTDEIDMGFNLKEINLINEKLWFYECELHKFAHEYGSEKAFRFHYQLESKVKKSVDRAFIMFKRELQDSIQAAQEQRAH